MIGINAFYGDGSCVRQIILPAEIDYIVKANRYIFLPGHDTYRVSTKFTAETSASLQYEGGHNNFCIKNYRYKIKPALIPINNKGNINCTRVIIG